MAEKGSATAKALAELYAQVQSMPESAQKKKLITKLNEANGHGTPGKCIKVPSVLVLTFNHVLSRCQKRRET